jgi:hypothetical protein
LWINAQIVPINKRTEKPEELDIGIGRVNLFAILAIQHAFQRY